MSQFTTGFIGGFAIAAPVGPIGMLCIRRSVADGRLVGFICGLGAATADVCYGSIAAFGLSTIAQAIVAEERWVQLVGGLILIALGFGIFRAHPTSPKERLESSRGLWKAYASTLVLTLMNPMTILSFLAIFAGLGLGALHHTSGPYLLVLGVFLGSVTWWVIVSTAGGWLGDRLEHGGMRVVNMISGGIICGLGAWQLVEAARSFGLKF